MQLGQVLREKRKALGWTQGVAAQKIGIQQSYLSKLENNQFIPSQEVLEQLRQVYGIELPLIPNSGSNSRATPSKLVLIVFAVSFLCSVAIIATAQSGLIYSHTYYTYEANLVGDISEKDTLLSYELTDEYRGEVYQAKFAGYSYRYELLGSRDITRKENTVMTLLGVFLMIVSAFSLLLKLRSD